MKIKAVLTGLLYFPLLAFAQTDHFNELTHQITQEFKKIEGYYTKLSENIEDAQSAYDAEDMKLYLNFAATNVNEMISTARNISNYMKDINKLATEFNCTDLEVLVLQTEKIFFKSETYLFDIEDILKSVLEATGETDETEKSHIETSVAEVLSKFNLIPEKFKLSFEKIKQLQATGWPCPLSE